MAIVPGLTPPAAPHLPTPPSLNIKPAGTQTGTSDAASTGGYGSTYSPPPTAQSYVMSQPNVMSAQSQFITGANQLNTNFRNNLNSAVTWFGDPTAWAPQNQPTVGGGLTSENGNNLNPAAPNQSLAQALGYNVDPAVAALARGNTIGPGGAAGNSIVAQLHLAAANARNAAVTSGMPGGGAAVGSGNLGVNVNNQNIVAGQNMFNAVRSFQDQIQQMNQGRIQSIDQLRNNVMDAIVKANSFVGAHPGQFPVTTQGVTTPVGTSTPGSNGLAADQPLTGLAGYNPAAYVPGGTAPWIARRMQAMGYAS